MRYFRCLTIQPSSWPIVQAPHAARCAELAAVVEVFTVTLIGDSKMSHDESLTLTLAKFTEEEQARIIGETVKATADERIPTTITVTGSGEAIRACARREHEVHRENAEKQATLTFTGFTEDERKEIIGEDVEILREKSRVRPDSITVVIVTVTGSVDEVRACLLREHEALKARKISVEADDQHDIERAETGDAAHNYDPEDE